MTMTFNPANYEPFDRLGPNHELNQRLIQVGSQAGSPPNFDDLQLINELSEQMHTVAFGQISPLDRNKDAHDMALEYIDTYLSLRDNETIYADHLGVQFDPELAQQTTNRVYGILASNPGGLHPLSNDWTWEQVSHKYLSRAKGCDVQVTYACREKNPTLRFAIRAGDYAVIFASCQKCRDWFDEDPLKRHRLQKRNFGDLWSVGKNREHRVRDDRND